MEGLFRSTLVPTPKDWKKLKECETKEELLDNLIASYDVQKNRRKRCGVFHNISCRLVDNGSDYLPSFDDWDSSFVNVRTRNRHSTSGIVEITANVDDYEVGGFNAMLESTKYLNSFAAGVI